MQKGATSPNRSVSTLDKSQAELEPKIRHVLGAPPLYKGEVVDDYDGLYDCLRSAVRPTDAIEELWLRDITDITWDTLRLRRLKAGLMDASRAYGVERIVRKVNIDIVAEEKLFEWGRGETARKIIEDDFRRTGLDENAIEVNTFFAQIREFERIDSMITRLEERRNRVLREVDRYRDVVASRMRDALADIEDAEFEDVVPGRVPA